MLLAKIVSFLYRLVPLVVLCALAACATPIPPAGGIKDEIPPRIVPEKSTPNLQTNFRPKSIELTFDEWVKVTNAFTEIISSPPLDFEIKLRGKTVQLNIDEDAVLRDSATYVINFGKAIQDLTESNPATNLRFVFSTGPVIDSLEVKGRVVDAYTGLPVADVLFMLYENTVDSVVRTEKPFYFSRTDTSGRFTVSNVRAGAFKGFALEDADRNYLYNQPTERIGFPDSLVVAGSDSTQEHVIRLFQALPPPRVATVDTSKYGRITIGFNQSPAAILAEVENSDRGYFVEREADSLRIFFAPATDRSIRVRLQQDTLWQDTVYIRSTRTSLSKDSLRLLVPLRGTSVRQNPALPVELSFSHPLASIDTSAIRLLVDTTLQAVSFQASIDSTRQRQLTIAHSWRPDALYLLQLLPNALTDWYGRTNTDTLAITLQVEARKNFGNYLLTFTEGDPDTQYLVRLTDKTGRLITDYLLSGATTYQRSRNALPAGDYRLEVIVDTNRNGRWDTGDYTTGQQPEPVQIRPLESLRANWDVEATVILEE